MKVGSLFSGVGGFDLGLDRCGCKTIWHSETDGNAVRVPCAEIIGKAIMEAK